MTAVEGMVGVLYPNGETLAAGSLGEALSYAESCHLQTALVLFVDGEWLPDGRLPTPRPRGHSTPRNPGRITRRIRQGAS